MKHYRLFIGGNMSRLPLQEGDARARCPLDPGFYGVGDTTPHNGGADVALDGPHRPVGVDNLKTKGMFYNTRRHTSAGAVAVITDQQHVSEVVQSSLVVPPRGDGAQKRGPGKDAASRSASAASTASDGRASVIALPVSPSHSPSPALFAASPRLTPLPEAEGVVGKPVAADHDSQLKPSSSPAPFG